jgi:3-isopropylmalate dehydrogenase
VLRIGGKGGHRVKHIALLPGDGIGPEVVEAAVHVMQACGQKFGMTFAFEEALFGGCAIDATGEPLPPHTLALCQKSDAVLLGAVGGPQWDVGPKERRPETGLLGLRKHLGLYANLRPAIAYDCLANASSIRPEVLRGTDLLVVRELTGGIYFGEKERHTDDRGRTTAIDTCVYAEDEITRIAHQAFAIARGRRKHVTSVDKANVLETSRLWREVVTRVSQSYRDVTLEHMLVDNCAMQLLRRPTHFDVVLTENMFGDILSDEAAMLTGSIGLLASASLGDGAFGLYEPVHGSAPDIAGQGIANPIATILSVSMMFRLTFGYNDAADAIERAVQDVLRSGARTADLGVDRSQALSTSDMTARIIAALHQEHSQT